MKNKKDYTKCTWKDCEKCNEMSCLKYILKGFKNKRTMRKAIRKIIKKKGE